MHINMATFPPSGAVITPSGNIVTEELDISGFDRVDISSTFAVEIRRDEAFRVALRVDENALEHLEVGKQGDTLKIGLKGGTIVRCGSAGITLEATVTMPDLVGVGLSGASRVTLSGFESARSLDVKASGASRLSGDITAGDVRCDLSGASQLRLRGSAGNVRIHASGASTVDLVDFPATDAHVEMSGASKATVNASGRLDAAASGASSVLYLGDPTLGAVRTSGVASIKRR